MSSTINSFNNNVQFQKLVKDSAKDGKVEYKELEELFFKVSDLKVTAKEKQEMYNFFQEVSNRTINVDPNTQKELTSLLDNNDIETLKSIAPKNNIAKLMLGEILKSQSELKSSSFTKSNENISKPGNFEPDSGAKFNLLGNIFSGNKKEEVKQPKEIHGLRSTNQSGSVKSTYMSDSSKAEYLRDQNDSPFKSKSGDCGPTSIIMMLRANNVNVDLADIARLRKDYKAPDANGKGPFAASFKSLKDMAESEAKKVGVTLKGGAVSSFSGSQKNRDDLVKFLRNELKDGKMPLLCTGQTPLEFIDPRSLAQYKQDNGKDFKPVGRHYTMVVGVNDDGSIRVADPGGGNIRDYSSEELLGRMNGKAGDGNPIKTEVMSFERLN